MRAPRGVAVVTGASYGVGRACARLFAARGWDLGLLARGEEGLDAARREAEALGRRALALPTDVSDPAAVERAAAAVEAELGPIEIWVNDAMVSVFSPVSELEAEELRRVTEVAYLGTAYGTMAALRRMRPRNRGVIVQVGSALAYRSIPWQAAYCGAKHAMKGFTEALRCELLREKSRVRVVMAQLPAVNTPHFSVARTRLRGRPRPVPPVFQPEVAARAVYAAAMGRRRELFFGLFAAAAVAGEKLAPGLLDRYLALTAESSELPEPPEPGRPDNLWSPPPGDLGAHGIFDGESASTSPHLHWRRHRAAALAGLAAAAVFGRRRWKKR